jgi:hypothetical protein
MSYPYGCVSRNVENIVQAISRNRVASHGDKSKQMEEKHYMM